MALIFLLTLSLFTSVSCLSNKDEVFSKWAPNEDSWNYWWSYSGVSGPSYWGLLNLDWFMCDKGRRQSPINIETSDLVYDPNLTPLSADNNLISGILYNDGHAIVFNATLSPSLKIKQKSLAPISNSELSHISGSFSNGNSSINDNNISNNANNDSYGSISKRDNLNHDENRATLFDLVSVAKLESTSSLFGDLNNVKTNLNNDIKLDDGFDFSADSSDDTNPNVLDDENIVENEPDVAQLEKVHISGAGLMYSYKFEALYLRFGNSESNIAAGSEHQIDSHSYAAEIQIMSYNSILYKSYSEALNKPQGLLGIAIMVDLIIDENSSNGQTVMNRNLNEPLEELLSKLDSIKHRGFSVEIRNFNLSALLPELNSFVIYEGSLTIPGCDESVNWLVLNKPLYISQSKLTRLRSISAEEQSTAPTGTLIAGNIRPIQPVNRRSIRTNIKPPSKNQKPETCKRLWTRYEYKHSR